MFRYGRSPLFSIGLLGWVLGLCPGLVSGQSMFTKARFSRIDVSSGLSNSHVSEILQDHKGFMWFCTPDGINRYDGYSFQVYRKRPGDSTGLQSNHALSIFEDHLGEIWASTTNNGMYHYDKNADKFVAVTGLPGRREAQVLLEDYHKTLWAAGFFNGQTGMASYNRTTRQWKIHSITEASRGKITGEIYACTPVSDHEFMISTNGRHTIIKWNTLTNKVEPLPALDTLLTEVYDMIQDDSGFVWIAARNGLGKYNPRTGSLTHFLPDPAHPTRSLPVPTLLDLCMDGKYLWIATENGGLSRLNRSTLVFNTYTANPEQPLALSDNSIWSVYKDRQNRIWIGSFSKGLCVYDHMRFKFSELDLPIENDVVNAIWEDSRKRLWIGTERGLILKNGTTTTNFRQQKIQPGSLSSKPVLSIFEDSRQRMWFGMWDGGTSRYDDASEKFIVYAPSPRKPKGLTNPNVYSIWEDRLSQHMLVSTYNGMHTLTDEDRGEFSNRLDSGNNANNFGRVIYQDHRGIVWFGTITGLNRIDMITGKTRTYFLNRQTERGIWVNAIIEDATGNLWVGTNSGLVKIVSDEIVQTYTTQEGLPNNIVTGIMLDDHAHLWLSTTTGLSVFDPVRQTFTNFQEEDGLLSHEFKPGAYFKRKDGVMFFGGHGVTVFHPDSMHVNPFPPRVYITGLRIFSNPVQIGDEDGVLTRAMPETQEITLRPEFNAFTIEYVGLNYTAPSKNQYRYMLEGFDRTWNQVGNQRFANFTNLDPGTYRFRVMACNNDGVWNKTGATLVIHILPDWYETLWFRIATGAMVLLFTTAGVYLRTRNIRQTNQRLEYMVEQKTCELKEANQHLTEQEEAIREQNLILTEQREELAAQNEEMILTQEEVLLQRDTLLWQNQQLQEAQHTIEEQNNAIRKQNESLEDEVNKRTRELVEYNYQLEQYAFISSHNLRAPIARILGLSQLLDTSSSDTERQFVFENIVRSVQQLDTIVHDLNVVVSIKRNSNAPITEIAFADVVRMIGMNLENEILAAKATLLYDFQVPVILTVKPYLDSILFNLVSNAIKYRHADRASEIRIRTFLNQGQVCMEVQDNGLGIDLALAKDKLFMLYQRFHLHTEGKGLGLYLVKTQVQALGATIHVESEVNLGTTFTILFRC